MADKDNTDDTNKLGKFLKQKTKLFKETSSKGDTPYINLLSNLVDEYYIFTKSQFDSLFLQMTYGSKPFILNSNNIPLKICTYIFSNYDLDDDKIQKILPYTLYPNNFYILNILFKNNYEFTIDNYRDILSSYYTSQNLIFDKYNNNIVFLCCISIKNDPKCIFFGNNKKLLNGIVFDKHNFNVIMLADAYITNNNARIKFNELMDIVLKSFINNDKEYIFNTMINKNYGSRLNCYVFYKYIINNLGYNEAFANHIEQIYLKVGNNMLIFDLALKGYKITEDHLNTLVSIHDRLIIPLNDEYANIGMPFIFLKKYQSNTYASIPIIDLYGIFGISKSVKLLNMVMSNGKIDLASELLNKYNIIPNKETLDNAVSIMHCSNNCSSVVTKILNYRIVPNSDTIRRINTSYSTTTINNIEILIKYGLILTFEDVEYLLSKKVIIQNLERFGIDIDERIYFLCFYYDVVDFVYKNNYKFDMIPTKILTLHSMCKVYTNMSTIDSYLEENNIKLDKYALHYLIVSNKTLALKYIEKYKLLPSPISAYKNMNLNISHKDIMEQNNLTYFHMLEGYDMK